MSGSGCLEAGGERQESEWECLVAVATAVMGVATAHLLAEEEEGHRPVQEAGNWRLPAAEV